MEGKQYKIIVTDENIVGAIGLAAYFGVTNSQSNNESRSTDGTDSNPVIPLSPDSNSSTSTPDQTSPCCSFDNVTCSYACDQSNGCEWTANNNWLSPSSFCIWYSVTCDSSGTFVC